MCIIIFFKISQLNLEYYVTKIFDRFLISTLETYNVFVLFQHNFDIN